MHASHTRTPPGAGGERPRAGASVGRGGVLRRVLAPSTLARLTVGWAAVLLTAWTGILDAAPAAVALAGVVAVIVYCAFGVVGQAEALAVRLGEPFGTLVLTLSVVCIEVLLIAAMTLGGAQGETAARDSVTAVTMIILNLVVGACVLVAVRRGAAVPNRRGMGLYLAMIVPLGVLTFAVPHAFPCGAYPLVPGVALAVAVAGAYAVFLRAQTGRLAHLFAEPGLRRAEERAPDVTVPGERVPEAEDKEEGARRERRRPRDPEIPLRAALLVATVAPVSLLAHDMAGLTDTVLAAAAAPPALAGLLVAAIVFLPESITALRAAAAGQVQRVGNLAHGALVSTVGLTVPCVLVLGAVTGRAPVLAESPANLALLAATAAVSCAAVASGRLRAWHGVAHLALFGVFAVLLAAG
ncbi:calcium:proton antiporter [Corynebacterium frankenforstense]